MKLVARSLPKILVGLFLSLPPAVSSAALVDPSLRNFAAGAGGRAQVLVLMNRQFSRPLPARANGRLVRLYLRDETRVMYNRIASSFANLISRGDIVIHGVYAINQSFSATVSPAALRILATTDGISKIYAEGRIGWTMPVNVFPEARPRAAKPTDQPYAFAQMGLDRLAKSDPGLNGAGVVIGQIDTGVDGKHPALAGKLLAFYDAGNDRLAEAVDYGDHGTHTAAIMVGAPRNGIPLGVAPAARLIAAAGLTGYDSMLKSMSFMLDPDGNPETEDAPRLVSNSWHCQGAPDLEAFFRAIDAWEAAGIFTLFSAGNSGPQPRTLTTPHEHPLSFSVAAHDQKGRIASFSSRGPGLFNGQDTLKPDLSAPGVDILSAMPGGGYLALSGTSMATPHVAGLAALLLQIEPSLTPARLREILIQTADNVDINGTAIPRPQWNPSFGFGRVNALKAVNLLRNLRTRGEQRWGTMMAPAFDFVDGLKARVLPAFDAGASATAGLEREFPTDPSVWVEGRDL